MTDWYVVLGGEGPAPAPPAALRLAATGTDPSRVAVAADSGLELAADLDLPVDHLVGDLDSVDPGLVVRAQRRGVTVHRHPADKDATDAELALDLVSDLAGPQQGGRLTVLGRGGGRLDLLLADLLLMAHPRLDRFSVTAHFGAATVTVVAPHRPRSVHGSAGEQISLLAMGGPVTGVTTDGLRWPLVDADLPVGTTRGVSNELLGSQGRLTVSSGALLAIQPGTHRSDIEDRSTSYDPTPVDLADRRA